MQFHTKALTRSIALAIASASAFAVAAAPAPRVVDPVAETLSRLKRSAANTNGGFSLTSIKLKGDINSAGLRFTLPNAVPEIPKVLMQGRIANCNNRDITGRADVMESTENSETFSKSMTIGSTTTVEVSYQSPVGLSVSGSQSLELSGTMGEEKTQAKTVGWNVGNDVPVGPRTSVLWQFVVSAREMKNIPWSADVIVGGPVELNYTKPPGAVTVCLHEHAGYAGKKKCYTTSSPLDVGRFKNEGWDNGKGSLNDEVTAVEIRGNAKVTLFEHTDYKGWNMEITSSSGNVGKGKNDKFSAMKIEPQGASKTVSANLETFLSDTQRRIALSGMYNGVNGVMGEFRAGAPVTLSDADCRVVPSNSAGNAQAAARTAPATNAVRAIGGGLVGVAPIEGKVLRTGITPTTQQVTVSKLVKTK